MDINFLKPKLKITPEMIGLVSFIQVMVFLERKVIRILMSKGKNTKRKPFQDKVNVYINRRLARYDITGKYRYLLGNFDYKSMRRRHKVSVNQENFIVTIDVIKPIKSCCSFYAVKDKEIKYNPFKIKWDFNFGGEDEKDVKIGK